MRAPHQQGLRVRTVLGALLVMCAVAGPGLAQDETAPGGAAEQAERRVELAREIETLRSEIEARRSAEAPLDQTIDRIDRDMDTLSRELVVVGGRIAEIESEVARGEERLQRLTEDETWLRRSLAEREATVATVLSALQRVGRNPPPAIAARPDDALAAVRGAMLLNAVLPELATEAEAVAADLEALSRLRGEAAAEWRSLERSLASLSETRQSLEELLVERRRARTTVEDELSDMRRETARLALRARDLGELVGGVGPATGPSEDNRTGGATSPAGTFLPPVSGRIVREFGETDASGEPSDGRSIAAVPGGTVFSPADGRVVYAGPFRSYGTLLLVDVGDHYHVLLAGMQRLDVEVGDRVVAGEPVGRMGLQRVASAVAIDLAASGPVLYVEIRENGEPIDPRTIWTGSASLKEVSE